HVSIRSAHINTDLTLFLCPLERCYRNECRFFNKTAFKIVEHIVVYLLILRKMEASELVARIVAAAAEIRERPDMLYQSEIL
ncbi:hypothetical protein L9F63_014759, partial [Diploptera punctata]